jgi:hypothetical protein
MSERRDLDDSARLSRRRLVLLQIIVTVLAVTAGAAELLTQASDKIVWATISGGLVIAVLIRIRIAIRY